MTISMNGFKYIASLYLVKDQGNEPWNWVSLGFAHVFLESGGTPGKRNAKWPTLALGDAQSQSWLTCGGYDPHG
jgi:hypothetical protein